VIEATGSQVALMVVNGKRSAPKQQRAIETRESLLLGASRVFARMSYSRARLKDIAEESGISEGALYFHFGNKSQIAAAILEAQQDRMTAVLTTSLAEAGSGLEKLFAVMQGLGKLVATDEVVQAGITLASEPENEVAQAARDPYFEWIRIARTLIGLGIDDGSVDAGTDIAEAAEFANYAFVGAQVISGMADSWVSLPERLQVVERALTSMLAPARAS
jgi:AcrR family transcriptional regulator